MSNQQPPDSTEVAGTSGAIVMGVDGPIIAGALGWTSMHEHLLVDLRTGGYSAADTDAGTTPSKVNRETMDYAHSDPFAISDNLVLDDIDLIVTELRAFTGLGGRTIVDTTPPDIGRSPDGLREIARRANVQVVMGAGHYRAMAHPAWLRDKSTDEIEAEIIGDLIDGVNGIHAGIIGEIGTQDPIDPEERRVLEAAARAQRATGRALYVHVHPRSMGAHDLLNICENEGADLNRVALCHLDTSLPDTAYHRSLAERGAWVSYDLFGDDRDPYEYHDARAGQRYPPDVVRVEAVVEAFRDGWADRLLLAHDICLKTRLWTYGGSGYDHIAARIVPRLRLAGLSESHVQQLFFRNPERLLLHSPSVAPAAQDT